MSQASGGHHDRVEFEEVVHELYGLPPGEFVAVREQRAAQARAAGDRDLSRRIHDLRRPTLAAWAVNQLVREQPQTADQILSLGSELRQAWTAANGPQLQELSARRHDVVHALAQVVRGVAYQRGHPLGDAAADEVQTTLDAALADPGIAREVCSGRLVRAHSYAGFGPVELPAPTAGTGIGSAEGPAAGRAARSAGTTAAGTGRGTAARAAGEGRTADREAADQVAADQVAADQVAADQVAADQVAAERRADLERQAAEQRGRVQRRAAERRRAERAGLVEAAQHAVEAAEAAEADLAAADEELAEGVQQRQAAEERIARLTDALAAAHQLLARAQREQRDVQRRRDRIAQRAGAARSRADRAQARLDRFGTVPTDGQ